MTTHMRLAAIPGERRAIHANLTILETFVVEHEPIASAMAADREVLTARAESAQREYQRAAARGAWGTPSLPADAEAHRTAWLDLQDAAVQQQLLVDQVVRQVEKCRRQAEDLRGKLRELDEEEVIVRAELEHQQQAPDRVSLATRLRSKLSSVA